MLRKICACALLLLIAACAEAPPRAVTPLTLDYTRLGFIRLAVGRVETVNYSPLAASADQQFFAAFKPQLPDAAYRWGADRLQAAGGPGEAVLSIKAATITRQKLPKRDGIGSWFTRAQGEKWIGQVTLLLQVNNAANGFSGLASASVTRSTTVPEDATPSEQENAYRRLLLGLMDDLNDRMGQSIGEHLGPVLLSNP